MSHIVFSVLDDLGHVTYLPTGHVLVGVLLKIIRNTLFCAELISSLDLTSENDKHIV